MDEIEDPNPIRDLLDAPAREKYDGLPKRARFVFDELIGFYRRTGHPPTVRQLAEVCSLSSTSTVQSHLDAIVGAGLIVRDHIRGRPAIRIVGIDTDTDVVVALAKTDPVYRRGQVTMCAVCEGDDGSTPGTVAHVDECPWLRARRLYADG